MDFGRQFYGHHPAASYFNGADSNADLNSTYESSTPDFSQSGEAPISSGSFSSQENPVGSKDPGPTLGIQDIGMSVPMGISAQNVAGIYSKIRMGAGKLEIQFPGYRSGNRQSHTPGMYGEDQRQVLREMQMANEVRLTTHGSMGIMGMMGRDERGNFSVKNAYQDMKEISRAIDFQADIGGGGSVVVHSGEFDRPMTDMYLDDESHRLNLARDSSGRLLVRENQTQEIDAKFDLLDARTSQKMETVEKDRLVAYPDWNRAKEDYEGVDVNGKRTIIKKGEYIDLEGRKVLNPYDPLHGRVPEYNQKTGRFKTRMMHFDDFKEEADEYNHWFEKTHGRKPTYYEKRYPEESFLHATLETQEGHARGWALQYGQDVQRHRDFISKLEKAKEYYQKLDSSLDEEEKWKIMIQDDSFRRNTEGVLPSETKNPLELIDKEIETHRKSLEFARQSSASQEQQAYDTAETKRNIITPIKRLEQQGVRMYAEAAIHAMKKTADPSNPVTITIENIFPERFGGHMEELKWIVRKSRDRMADMLSQKKIEFGVSRDPTKMNEKKLNEPFLQENPYYMGISKEQAKKIAEKHIKVTLDTGHLNLWRKYWQDDPKLSQEQNNENYRKWYLAQVETLAKEGMVGNVHLADNYGYNDDHLAPGQGNAPIKETVAILKKYGYDKAFTVEPGADASTDSSDFHGLMKTWRHFGGSIYGMGGGGGSGTGQAWSDVQNSYFGQSRSPNYVFGGYAPSNEWTMWSQVPLE